MRAAVAVFMVAIVGVLPGVAHAQGKGATAALSPQDEATARFQTGLKYYDARDFESARLAFAQAYAVLKKPAILLNLALSELYAARPLDALGHLDSFLSDPTLPAEKKERATKARDEAYAKTGHLRIKAAKGAEVKIDGDVLATVPEVVHVSAGEHTVTASGGDLAQTRTVMAVAGNVTEVDVLPPPMPLRTYETVDTVWGTRTMFGIFAGAAALGAGVVAIVETGVKNDALDRASALNASLPAGACRTNPPPGCRDLGAYADQADNAKHVADVATVAAVGLGVVSVGLVVSAFVWPHKRLKERYVVVGGGPAPMGMSLGVRF